MDRTSFKPRSHAEESSSDVFVESSGEAREPPRDSEKSIIPSSREVPAKLRATDSTPLQTIAETAESDEASAARTEVKPFSDAPPNLIQAFKTLRLCEEHGASKHNLYLNKKQANPDYKQAAAFVEKKAKKGENVEESEEFIRLQGNRSEPSKLEMFLPKDSHFRTLLFAPSGGVRDKSTGLYAELLPFERGSRTHFLLCFPGTGTAGNKDTQWKNNIVQAVVGEGPPPLYEQAAALASELKAVLAEDGLQLSLAGHSMGGGIANFAGLYLGIPSYTFNGAALGPGSISHLEIKGCLTPERIAQQHHLRLEKDFASSSGLAKGMARWPGKKRNAPQQIGIVYQANKTDPGFPTKASRVERHPLAASENLMRSQEARLKKMAIEREPANAPGGTTNAPTSTSGSPPGNLSSTSATPLISRSAPVSSERGNGSD